LVRILVTGFEPFGKLVANPSALLLEQLSADMIPGCSALRRELLPVAYTRSGSRIRALLEELQPDLCICLGVAQNRQHVCLERIAMNLDDCSLADNDGELAKEREIVIGESLALRSGLNLAALHMAVTGLNKPLEPGLSISNHAGNFVCNHVYYNALQHIACRRMASQCLFIHLPMSLECSSPMEEYAWELPAQSDLLNLVASLISAAAALIVSHVQIEADKFDPA
jgi:pyroglutamyl-peptidase